MTINLSPKELAAASQSQLDGFKNPNNRAMYGAMGINIGNVQEAQGIKSILQNAVAGQGAQQATPGGSIVDRFAEEAFAKYQEKKMQQEAQQQQAEMMKVAMGFRGMEPANGVGSLPVPGENYAEGGIVPFAKGKQVKVAAKEENEFDAALKAAKAESVASMEGLTRPEEVDEEGMFKRVYESNQAMGQPYVDKMNELIRKMRPDAESIKGRNRSNSIIQAGLAMLERINDGPGFARGLAGIAGGAQRGLNQYQEGEQNLQNQLQKHQAFEMEGIKNELGMRKDDLRYAQGMVEQARKEFGTKSREFRAAEANAERVRQAYMSNFLKDKDIRRREAEAISRDAHNQQKLLAAIGRNNSGGGGGVANLRDIIQTRREFQQNIRDLSGDTRYIVNLRKGLKTEGISATDLDKAVMDAVENAAAQRTGFTNLRDLYSFTGRPEGKVAAPPSTAPAAAPQTKPKLKLFE